MPDWLNFAVAFAALGISGFLAWLRFREWRAKPDLWLDMDWIVGGGGPSTLRIVAGNRGSARGGVRNIVLSPTETHDSGTSFAFLRHVDELPVMLAPGAFARFPIELDPNGKHTFTRQLLAGGFTYAILIDQNMNPKAFPIPDQPADQDNRVSLVGRVVKA